MHSLTRRSRRGRRRRARFPAPEAPRSEMTPMVDVSFLLLIFFMLTIQFRTLEGLLSAHLPKDAGTISNTDPPTESLDLAIRVLWPVRWSLGPWSTTDAAALAQRLVQVHRHEPDRRIAIDAHPGAVYSEVVSAFDAVQLAGWSEVVFVGSRE